MSRIYDETLECGCMLSKDGGGGMIPCESGYWEMTPKGFRSKNPPMNYETHIRCMRIRFCPNINQKILVRSDAPYHANKIGYFQFMGGPDKDVVVLSTSPVDWCQVGSYTVSYFCIDPQFSIFQD